MGEERVASEPSRWEVMARQRNARVIMCNTPDTYCLTDLAKHADRSVRALRNRLLISLSTEEVIPLLEEYKGVVLHLHQVVEKMCEAADLECRVPRSVKRLLGGNEDGHENSE